MTDSKKLLYCFPEIVERAAIEYEPHDIAKYLNDLASVYNSWYAREAILDDSDVQGYKLALIQSVVSVLKPCLHLLGIESPDRM